MSFSSSSQASSQIFNNADSFAMAFDEAWKGIEQKNENINLSTANKLLIALEKVKEHPFLIESPSEAMDVANFRIRLLKLS